MKKHTLALMLGAALLAGCTSIGHRFSWSDVEELRPGMTSYAQAVAKLGPPAVESVQKDGSKYVSWESAMEVVGAIVSPERVSIQFDKDDRMMRVVSRLGSFRGFAQ
jgi:outer membrane protein assembly factor BamE (lipoprotein component of BamABCDE complex)